VAACAPDDPELGPPVVEMLGLAALPGRPGTPEGGDDFHAQATAAAGIRWVRGDLTWEVAQPEPDRWAWGRYDRMFDEAVRDDKRVIALLAYGARWANAQPPSPRGSAHFPPDDPSDFADFAAAAVTRYRDRVSVWEVWNEPNSARFWQPTLQGDPAAYGTLLRATYLAIKAADPQATVLFGGLFYHDQVLTSAAPDFLAAAHEAHPDLADFYDGVAVHPYDLYPPRRGPESEDQGSVPLEDMLARVRKVLGRWGAGDRDLWVTEFGWPDFSGVSEASQAAYLAQATLLMAAQGVRAACWYTLWDGPQPSNVIPEDQFGLFRWQEAPPAQSPPVAKPAYEALVALRRAVGDLSFVEDRSHRGRRILVFGDAAGRRVQASWASGSGQPPIYD